MLNNLILIGRYYSIDKVSEDVHILSLVISNEDGDITLPITVNKKIADRINELCNEGDLFSVKGFISVDNNQLCVIASKLSFISKKA